MRSAESPAPFSVSLIDTSDRVEFDSTLAALTAMLGVKCSGHAIARWDSSMVPASGVSMTAPQGLAQYVLVPRVVAPQPVASPSPGSSSAEDVLALHRDSGLTWDQIGRMFGVSRRAVHLWAAGKRMNARNVELLGALRGLVDSAPATDSERRRTWLFAPGADGLCPVEQFMNRYRVTQGPGSGHGYTPAGLLGIDIDVD